MALSLASTQINRFNLVCALGVAQILAWGTTYYLPAVLATPIAENTGWSITFVVMGLAWGLLTAGACSPLAGRLIDRLGGRSVLAASSGLLAMGLLLMGLATNGAGPQSANLLPGMDVYRCGHGCGLV